MSETVQANAAALLTEVEKGHRRDPARTDGRGRAAGSRPRRQAEAIRKRMAEVDLANTQSIISLRVVGAGRIAGDQPGHAADVKNKDVGPAATACARSSPPSAAFRSRSWTCAARRSWWEKLLGRAAPFAEFVAKYEDVQGQIDKITGELLTHEHRLLKDIKSLDILYEKTLTFYDELALYIAAGEAKLAETGRKTIPAKEAEVAAAPRRQGDGGAGIARPARRPRRSGTPGA
jgi:hypothetical protein